MVGGLWVVVLIFKIDQNRLSGYRDFRGQNLDFCITLANGLYSPVLPYRCDVSLTPGSKDLCCIIIIIIIFIFLFSFYFFYYFIIIIIRIFE